ncbi:hypothetical protein [Paenibacillus sp. sgz500958]
MAKLEASGIKRIIILPLFPQYSTTTSACRIDGLEHRLLGAKLPIPIRK